MRTSVSGLNLIKEFESLHDGDASMIGLQPKMCPAKIWTEGYGRAMRNKNGQFLKGTKDKQEAYANITIDNKQEAEKALVEDLGVFERIVSSKIKISLTQNQFDALVSYTYNTGGSDTLFKLINQKASKEQIQKWFETKYITAGGVKLAGLVRRRKAESNLYFK
jgi:lysozyme